MEYLMIKNIKEYDELLYENRFNNNIIIKNYKTHVYESFNEEGIVNYKIVFIQKEDNLLYFKLVNEEAVIKYDINKFILYKINLNDFYLKKNNYIEYDKKKILFNT
jgi:molybdopterin/thiamine biosynthesis adenylyltransferase